MHLLTYSLSFRLKLMHILLISILLFPSVLVFILAYTNKETIFDTITLSINMIADKSSTSIQYAYDMFMLIEESIVTNFSDQHVEFINNSIMLESKANTSVIHNMFNVQKDSIEMRMKISINTIRTTTEGIEEREQEQENNTV